MHAFPGYINGNISTPVERRLYNRAKRIVEKKINSHEAKPLLDESIAIDPNSDGVYWLAEYYFTAGQYDRAEQQYTRFIELDRTQAKAYLEMSSIYAKKEQPEQARDVLQSGLNYFSANMSKYKPRPDDTVREKYNGKAGKIYDKYRRAVEMLKQEIKLYEEQTR